MKTLHLVFTLGFAAFVAAACSKSDKPSSATGSNETSATGRGAAHAKAATASVDMAKAKETYQERCAACHGATGRGDGPGATALNPKPRNYADKAWQATVTDEQIKKTITMGGAAVGKSPIMPASPDLEQKPEIIEGLVKVVRAFGG